MEKMKSLKLFDYLLCAFFAVNVSRNICLMIGISTVATALFYVSYVLFFVMIQFLFFSRCAKNEYMTGSFIFSVLLIALLLIIPSTYGFDMWVSKSYLPISFFLTMAFFIASKSVVVSELTMKICYMIQVLQALVALICSLFQNSFIDGALELKIGNPNQTAVMLWANFVFVFLYWAKNRYRSKGSFMLGCIMAGLIVLICLTKSRAVLLSLLICCCGYFFIKLFYGKKIFPRTIQIILFCAPLWTPIFLVLLSRTLPDDIVILNKSLFSGREHIWEKIFEEALKNPFACHLDSSPYYSIINVNNTETLKAWGCHNGLLSVMWNYGVCCLILVIVVLYNCIKPVQKKMNDCFMAKMIYLVVMASIVSLSFEDALLIGNICTTFMTPVLLIFGRTEEINREYRSSKGGINEQVKS